MTPDLDRQRLLQHGSPAQSLPPHEITTPVITPAKTWFRLLPGALALAHSACR
jgi:hypothetical protein